MLRTTASADVGVLIAGAGPTGLTLACELAVRGVRFRLVDRSAAFFGGSRADGIQPRTLEVFAGLGVLDRILAAGDFGIEMRAYRGGEVVWTGRMSEPTEPAPSVPYPNPWFVPQFRTEEILRERLAELGGRVEQPTGLSDFGQDAEGVTATLSTGETVRARYLVGADGGPSTVRRRLGIDFPGETDESTTMLFADARVDGIGRDHGRIWPGEDRPVSIVPLAGTDLFVVAARPPVHDEPIREYLQRQITTASGRADIVLREITWHTTWRSNTRLATRFRDGRVLLAGDAAHVHPPTGGQGMNTGIQDGHNLGWKLAAALTGAAPVVLDSYEPERMSTARTALDISTALLRKHQRGDDDAHVRGPEVHGLALNYRGGPLSRDERAAPGSLQAGDRAPDAPVSTAAGRVIRLFDLSQGPHWTLLSFGAAAECPVDPAVHTYRVAEAAGERTLVDHDGHLRAAYDVPDGSLVLIRPDGYLGLITGSAQGVTDYWADLHGTAEPPLLRSSPQAVR
ncbi:FAD-dependent monooxygenase [Amycolatopsis ultiminotia]|uniref:FAD-dependent monooxygenase n=1 Tax=Amycolatopsis ultiminotia TaxID=543629 RepID=A0ABP6V1A7_9PSEU